MKNTLIIDAITDILELQQLNEVFDSLVYCYELTFNTSI